MTSPGDPATGPLSRRELAPLVDELARRLGDGDVPVVLTLRNMDSGARQALADLFGLDRVPASPARVRVSRLVQVLRLESVDELRALVETLRGPLPDRRADRLADREEREGLWGWLASESAPLWPALGGLADNRSVWIERMRSQGARGGVVVHRQRLDRALRVIRALPAEGVPLAVLANDLLGDPHALDQGRRLAAIVLDAVALSSGAPLATNAETTRHLWESVGVAPDPLSSTVLALGLAADAPPPLGPWLAAASAAGEPVVLTLAQLRRWPLAPLAPGQTAYVVENPSLVAEAARRGWCGPPVICSAGRPTVAVVSLIRQLAAGGGSVRQHADFDAAGLAITAWLAERAGTTPWRMKAADYLAAAPAAADERRGEPSVLGVLPSTPWDPLLPGAMAEWGIPVYEEELRTDLLDAMV
ncbi:MAG TPA: TIGR02679 family protein [Acidimicrobiales bacterium]|nr:TIGR02679 family protein [Acidimicrobiales bacterium]